MYRMLWDIISRDSMPRTNYQPLPDDYDPDPTFENIQDKQDKNHEWLLTIAALFGSAMVLNSVNPKVSGESITFPESPVMVKDISDEAFSNIYKLEIKTEFNYRTVYSEQELNHLKSLGEELKQYGRLEDPKTIENKAFAWNERINDMTGQFGNNEAYKAGLLDSYISAETIVLIPWVNAGPNTCDECIDRAEEGPYRPEDYPEPQHYGEECLPGDPVPVEVETGRFLGHVND